MTQDLLTAVLTTGLPSPQLLEATASDGTALSSPALADPRASDIARCRMHAPLLLPIFAHADRIKAVGVCEVAHTKSQPVTSYALLASLAACLKARPF